MVIKKNTLIACLLTVVLLLMYETLFSSFKIQRDIANERQQLAIVEKELAKFQKIVDEREVIVDMYERQNFNEIKQRFQELANAIEKAYDRLEYDVITDQHMRMRFVYQEIAPVEDLYYFYDGLYSYVVGDITQTQRKMQFMLANYPNSEKARQAVNFLLAIYIVRNQNDEYIDIYNRFSNFRTSKLYYWLGQAYFNKGDYETASTIFTEMQSDQQYGFRSKMMLGMIAYAFNEREKSIDIFIDLNKQYTVREPYYDFAVLSLARLYAQAGYFAESLNTYDNYQSLVKGSISTELAYEIALIAKESGDYNRSMILYRSIINLPQTSDLFDKALAQVVIIQADLFDVSSARELVGDAVKNNIAYSDLMKVQEERLNVVQAELTEYFTLDEARKPAKRQEIYSLLDQIATIKERQRTLGDFGIKRSELDVIDFVTSEYSMLLKIVLETDITVKSVAEKPNDDQVRMIERQITDIDSLRVDLLTLMLINNLRFENRDEWNKVLQPSSFHRRFVIMNERNKKIITSHTNARRIAQNVIQYENMKQELADRQGSPAQMDTIQNAIDLLYEEAEYLLGEIDYTDDYLLRMRDELNYLSTFRQQTTEVKGLVALYYHQKLAERLARANHSTFETCEDFHNFNISVINSFIDDLGDMNLEYNYALLDVQFKEVLKMDKDYANLVNRSAETVSNEGM